MQNPSPNGFAGVVGDIKNREEVFESLKTGLSVRGIDGQTVSNDTVFLIGSSAGGSTDNEHLTAVFNGYRLEDGDHETAEQQIVRLYQHAGEDFASRINGSFQTAIYDAKKNTFHLATDKYGTKCIYYVPFDDGLIFSSHLTPLLATERVTPALDEQAVNYYLSSAVSPPFPGGRTLMADVKQLPPSTVLTWDGEQQRTHTYWDVSTQKYSIPDERLVERSDQLLRKSAEQHLERIEGAPQVALSGGLDSTLISAILDETADRKVRTFTYGATENLLGPGRERAAELNVPHTEVQFPSHLVTPAELWRLEAPWRGMLVHRHQLLPEHGISGYLHGRHAETVFPAGNRPLSIVERFRGARATPSLARLLQRCQVDSVFRHLPDVAGLRLDETINILTSPHQSASFTRQLQDRRAQQLVAGDSHASLQRLERQIDAQWELPRHTFSGEHERFLYTQLRESALGISHSSCGLQQHPVFLSPDLLALQFSTPFEQRRGRRILKRLKTRHLPDNLTFDSSMAPYDAERKRYIARNLDTYRETVEQFLDRNFFDEQAARRYLFPASIERASPLRIRFMTKVYLLERWIQTLIERPEPWKPPR